MKISQVDNKITHTSNKLDCDLATTMKRQLLEILNSEVKIAQQDFNDLNNTTLSEVKEKTFILDLLQKVTQITMLESIKNGYIKDEVSKLVHEQLEMYTKNELDVRCSS